MNSLMLGLALASGPSAPAHPPAYPVPAPVVSPYRPPSWPGYPVPAPPVVPGLPAGRPMTLAQFAHCFTPTPGHHEVCLIHPRTGRPVHVCFDLPPGCPKVRVNRHEVEFDYGRREVEIQFRHNGTVRVDYD